MAFDSAEVFSFCLLHRVAFLSVALEIQIRFKEEICYVEHWNKLSREVVDVPSLATFKVMLDGSPSNLLWLQMSLLTKGGLN